MVYVGSDRNEAERADFVTEHGDWLLLPHEDPVIELVFIIRFII